MSKRKKSYSDFPTEIHLCCQVQKHHLISFFLSLVSSLSLFLSPSFPIHAWEMIIMKIIPGVDLASDEVNKTLLQGTKTPIDIPSKQFNSNILTLSLSL